MVFSLFEFVPLSHSTCVSVLLQPSEIYQDDEDTEELYGEPEEEEEEEEEDPSVHRRRPNSFGGGGFFGSGGGFSPGFGADPFFSGGDGFFGGFGSPFGSRRPQQRRAPQPQPSRAHADQFRRRQSHPQRQQRAHPQHQPQPQGRSVPTRRPVPHQSNPFSGLPRQQQTRAEHHPHNIPAHFSHDHRAHEHPTRSHERVHSQNSPKPVPSQHQSPAFEPPATQPDPNVLKEQKFLKACAKLEPSLSDLKSQVEDLEAHPESEEVSAKEILVISELIIDIEVALDNLELPKVPAKSVGIISTPESPKPELVSDPELRKHRKALIDLAENLQSRLKVLKSKQQSKQAQKEEANEVQEDTQQTDEAQDSQQDTDAQDQES